MAVATEVDAWTDRRRRTGELRERQPFARQVLDLYGALLPVQEKAYRQAMSDSPSAANLAAYVAELVVPVVLDVTLSTGPERLRSQLSDRVEAEHPRRMVEQWIAGEEQPMVDRYLARASLGPVLEALGAETRAECGGPRDPRHCPDCGGPPQVSFFAQAPEDLASGLRYLECARCGASWTFARMTCAGCGEDSSGKLQIFSEVGTTSGERGSIVRGLPAGSPANPQPSVFPHLRIEACESCRRYTLNVDLASDPRAVPVVDELAAIPLDLYARERGFSKITTNLMGF
jgi:FdhE protein